MSIFCLDISGVKRSYFFINCGWKSLTELNLVRKLFPQNRITLGKGLTPSEGWSSVICILPVAWWTLDSLLMVGGWGGLLKKAWPQVAKQEVCTGSGVQPQAAENFPLLERKLRRRRVRKINRRGARNRRRPEDAWTWSTHAAIALILKVYWLLFNCHMRYYGPMFRRHRHKHTHSHANTCAYYLLTISVAIGWMNMSSFIKTITLYIFSFLTIQKTGWGNRNVASVYIALKSKNFQQFQDLDFYSLSQSHPPSLLPLPLPPHRRGKLIVTLDIVNRR